jgi:hypothetical protein
MVLYGLPRRAFAGPNRAVDHVANDAAEALTCTICSR